VFFFFFFFGFLLKKRNRHGDRLKGIFTNELTKISLFGGKDYWKNENMLVSLACSFTNISKY